MDSKAITTIKLILNRCNIQFTDFTSLNGLLIPRDILISDTIYKEIQNEIHNLKGLFSSSSMTSLQLNAQTRQKWPLLNLVRQTLKNINYKMIPIRKSDGYTKQKVKKYKRFFRIEAIQSIPKPETKVNTDTDVPIEADTNNTETSQQIASTQ